MRYLHRALPTLVASIGLILLAASGCGPANRLITYDVSRVARGKPVALDKVLNVRPLRDGRRQVAMNAPLFRGDSEVKIGEQRVCVNAEVDYAPGSVPRQITALVARHLRQRRAFKNVVYGANDGADYQLVGVLTMFYARQAYDYGAAVGGAFGLIGALAVANNSEPTEVIISFTKLQLLDRQGRLVGKLDDIVVRKTSKEPSDANCIQVYNAPNRYLYSAISMLANAVERTIAVASAPTPELPAQAHCGSDRDCSGDLVCARSVCATATTAATAVAPPEAAAAASAGDGPVEPVCTGDMCVSESTTTVDEPNPVETPCISDKECPGELICTDQRCSTQ
jgi:hypothetical protein